jgi:hypothetical protein
VIQSVTENVKKVLESATGGVLLHEVLSLQSSTPYQPLVKVFPNASNDIREFEGIHVTTVPDAVRNVRVKKVEDSLDTNILWESSFTPQGGKVHYRVVIDGRDGHVNFNSSPQSYFPFCISLGDHKDGFIEKDMKTTIQGLQSNSWYEVRIAAFGANAAVNLDPCPPPLSRFSKPLLFKTNVYQVSSPPHSIKAYEVGPYAIAVQWEFPDEPGGNIIEFIVKLNKVTVSYLRLASPYKEFRAAVVERNHVFTDVSEGDFYVSIQARNEKGLGLPIESSVISVTSPRQGMPNVTVTDVSESSATIIWMINESLSNDNKFNVLLQASDDCRKGNASDVTDISSGVYNAKGLHPFTAYSVCVWDSKLPLNLSPLAFFITRQSTPMGRITVYDVSNLLSLAARTDSALLRWTPVDRPNGVVGYEIIVTKLGLGLNTRFSLLLGPNQLSPPRKNGTSLFYQWRVTGLEAGAGYNFHVRPYNLLFNTFGNGSSITVFTFIEKPGQPTISSSSFNRTSVTIRWDPPLQRNGDIQLYALALSAPDEKNCLINQKTVSVTSQESEVLQYTFTGLLPATSYVATIQAKTAAGYGEMSLPLVVMTTPHGSCLSSSCSNRAICVPHPNTFRCFCISGYIGDGHICVEQSFGSLVTEALSSEIRVTGLQIKHGDYMKLNNTIATIRLLTPAGQLLQSSRSPFQMHHSEGVTLYPVTFEMLHPGIEYGLEFSFHIGSFIQHGKALATTQSSVPQAPPRVLNITDITNISAAVLWQPPPRAFRNGPLTGYDVVINSIFTINGSFVNMTRITGHITSMIIDGLIPFQEYEVKVAARTSEGRGPWSDVKSFKTKYATPCPPRIYHAFHMFNGSVSYIYVTWLYPTIPGGVITHFLISAWSEDVLYGSTTAKATENALLLESTISLNISSQHQTRVQAISISSHGMSTLTSKDVQSSDEEEQRSDESESGFVEPVEVNPVQLCHGASPFGSAHVTNITQSATGNFSAVVTWSKEYNFSIFTMLSNVTYHVFSMRGKEDCKRISIKDQYMFNASNISSVLSNLLPNSIYSVCIAAVSTVESCIVFARTFVVTPQSVPGPINSLSLRGVTSESAEVTWLPPTFPNGVVWYEVVVKEINGSNKSFVMKPSDLVIGDETRTIGLLLSSLHGEKIYNMSVRACILKTGDCGPLISEVLRMKPGVPRPPNDVTAMSNRPNSIELHWSPSVSDGVTSYQITSIKANTTSYRLPNYFTLLRVDSVNATTLKYTVHGLEPNTTYALWVKTMGFNTESHPNEVVLQKTKVATTLLSRCSDLNCILSELRYAYV